MSQEVAKEVEEVSQEETSDYDYDDPYDDKYYDDSWEEELRRDAFEYRLDDIREGREIVTAETVSSVEDPDERREMIEAICLSRVPK